MAGSAHQRLLLLLFFLFPFVFIHADNVHFVDQTPSSSGLQNYLFRGGNPDFNSGYLNYPSLVSEIQAAGLKSNVTVPSQFYLIDINFLNDWQMYNESYPEDGNNTAGEFLFFFQQHKELGMFVFWETSGSYDNCTSAQIGTDLRDFMVKTLDSWSADRLNIRMEKVRKMLYTDYSRPTVIYGHCDCGCDRTGEMFGSYYMKWLNMTWEQANDLNTISASRPMDCFNYLAMQWYCLYLNQMEGRKDLTCLNQQPCGFEEVCITLPLPPQN